MTRQHGWLVVALLLTGCATPPDQVRLPQGAPTRIDVDSVPFFPQSRYQCGPAALATVLVASGSTTTPAQLVDEVFLPARRGSLQLELQAATRQRGRIAYQIEPTLESLVAELTAGRPVLVLLNLGLGRWPIWHYAVVVGFDAERERFVLRSGTTRRREMRASRFAGAWRRGARWGMLALAPGSLPAGNDVRRYVAAVADLESVGRHEAAMRAYQAGDARWPSSTLVQLGQANTALALGDTARAERLLAELLRQEPANVPARNNLAELLAKRGCRDAALIEARHAQAIARGGPFESAVNATVAEIEAMPIDTFACK